MSIRIEEEKECSEQTLDAIRAGMRRYTESKVAWEEYVGLNLIARGEQGDVIGALIANIGRGWLYIDVLWVDESSRTNGLGTKLMRMAEEEAKRRGCHGAYLNTFSYQAKPFYEKLGYAVFGTLDDFPAGHQRFYMVKKL